MYQPFEFTAQTENSMFNFRGYRGRKGVHIAWTLMVMWIFRERMATCGCTLKITQTCALNEHLANTERAVIVLMWISFLCL